MMSKSEIMPSALSANEGEAERKMREILATIGELRDAQGKLESVLSRGPASFYFEKLGDYITGLFSFSKFKIGDAVALAHDHDFSRSPGWHGREHFIKKGAAAKITDIDYGKRGFSYGIEFDNETWIDDFSKKGKAIERPVDRKGQYWFGESALIGARER